MSSLQEGTFDPVAWIIFGVAVVLFIFMAVAAFLKDAEIPRDLGDD